MRQNLDQFNIQTIGCVIIVGLNPGGPMSNRAPIAPELIADVLVACRRRCCICFALTQSTAEKKGQIAHLDHDPSNNSIENLVFLCLDHHDQYDSRTSQSKGLTVEEVRRYRAQLEEFFSLPLTLLALGKARAEKSSEWHEKRIDALVAIYGGFRKYLEFLRRCLYIPGKGLSLDPYWDFRDVLDKNMVYLNDSLQRDVQRFSGELLEFWNWAQDQPRPGGIDDSDAVQSRLDYEIPGYLDKLRKLINAYAEQTVGLGAPKVPAHEAPKRRRVEFRGIVWRERHGQLLPCCPKCDLELSYRHVHPGIDSRFTLGPVRYLCGECGWGTKCEGTHGDLVEKVRRKLERDERVENGI